MTEVYTYGFYSLLAESPAMKIKMKGDMVNEIGDAIFILPEYLIQNKLIPDTFKKGNIISFEQLIFTSLLSDNSVKKIAIINTSLNLFSVTIAEKHDYAFRAELLATQVLSDFDDLSQEDFILVLKSIEEVNNEHAFNYWHMFQDIPLGHKKFTVTDFNGILQEILNQLSKLQITTYDSVLIYGDLINHFKIKEKTVDHKKLQTEDIRELCESIKDNRADVTLIPRKWNVPLDVLYDRMDKEESYKIRIIENTERIVHNKLNILSDKLTCVGRDLQLSIAIGNSIHEINEPNLFSSDLNEVQLCVYTDGLFNINLKLLCEKQELEFNKTIINYFECLN